MLRIFFLNFVFCFVGLSVANAADEKRSISAEIFGQLPSIDSIELSPNGMRVLSLSNYEGRQQLFIQSLDATDKRKAFIGPKLENAKLEGASWLSNDRLVAHYSFPSRRGRTETTEGRIIAMNWDMTNILNLVKKQRKTASGYVSQFQGNIVSDLPDDPDHILLELDESVVAHPDIFKVNIHTAKRKRILKSRSHVVDWMADEEGVVRLGFGQYKTRDRIIYRKSADDRWQTIAKYDAIDDDIPFSPVGFSADPSIIYVSALDEEGRKGFYKYDLDKGEFLEQIAGSDRVDISRIDIDEEGNIRSYSYSDEEPYTVYKDKKWNDIVRFLKKNFPGDYVSIKSYSEDEKKFIFKVTSPTNPGDFHLLDLNTKHMSWFADTYPGLDRDKLSDMKIMSYKARDGLEIPAYLSLPKGKENQKGLPTIIMPHGGPQARDVRRFDYWVQFLTTRGYAVLQMNYRGSTGYGIGYQSRGRHEWGGKMLDDINDGARWMISEGYADPARICIMGGSYGGYAALQAVVKEQDIYKCSISFAPVTDMSMFAAHRRNFVGKERYLNYIRNDDLSFSDVSPYSNMDKINIPVLLMHGTKDRSVRYKQGKKFAKRMKSKKKDIHFITFEDGDHYLSNEKHRIEFLKEVEKFLAKNL